MQLPLNIRAKPRPAPDRESAGLSSRACVVSRLCARRVMPGVTRPKWMVMGLEITTLIIAVTILTQPLCAQDSTPPLGWDLTYSSVLERNNIGSGEWIRQWLGSGYQA